MAVNLLILYLTAVTLKDKAGFSRLFLSALTGTAFAFLLPFITAFVFLYKVAAAAAMTAIFKHKSLKAYFMRLAVFVAYSFFLGGIISGLFNLNSGEINGAVTYNSGRVVWLTAAGCAIFFAVIRKLYLTLKQKNTRGFYYKASLSLGSFCEETVAYYDSGNRLYDPVDKTPVAVVARDLGERIIQSQNPETYDIEINTVGGKNTLKAFKCDKMVIYSQEQRNIIETITVAIADGGFKNFKILLHNDSLSNLKSDN
jgi:stage II sporulation protein GA (sporulation sigma-E factor processing peptidase)